MVTEILLSIAVTLAFAVVAWHEYVSRLGPNNPNHPDSTDSARPVRILLAACVIGGNAIIWTAGLFAR